MNEFWTEHEYLEYCITTNYQQKVEEMLFPIYKKKQEALRIGDHILANILDAQAQITRLKLVEENIKSEDILRWLRLDNVFRETGTTYPDIIEGTHGQLAA